MRKVQIGEFEEVVLLAVGILHGNAYGVTIKDEIEDKLDRKVSVGALQTTLRRLEKKGLLESARGDTSKARAGRPKLYFTMTVVGKKAIADTREARDKLWKSLPEIILTLDK